MSFDLGTADIALSRSPVHMEGAVGRVHLGLGREAWAAGTAVFVCGLQNGLPGGIPGELGSPDSSPAPHGTPQSSVCPPASDVALLASGSSSVK